jgi:magnesium-transporting ATPase (P-type)
MHGQEFEDKISWAWEEGDTGGLKGEVKDLEAFDEIQKNLRVIARSSYQHKYMLVTGLKQLESVVAVTGDGTNDAAALK